MASTATVNVQVNVTYNFQRPQEPLPQEPCVFFNEDGDDCRLSLSAIHTIPVYEGITAIESYFKILNEELPLDLPVSGWANIGIFENEEGEVVTLPIAFDE